jgi:F0F1-type ATP synthase assembly protein I
MATLPPEKVPSEDQASQQDNPPSGGRKPAEDLSSWYRITGLGVEFIAAVAVMGALGWYADKRFDTRPVLLMIGVGVGFAVGLWMVIRVAMKSFR